MATTGGTIRRGRPVKPLDQKLWSRVDRTGGGCWEWTGTRTRYGYGDIRVGPRGARRHVHAHRVAWEVTNGPIPDGLFVCHHCDNRPCCRPDHLFLGTNDDNLADAKAKGRRLGRIGRLTPEQVRLIRSAIGTQRALAPLFGVSHSTINCIRRGKLYRAVGDV